VAKSDIKESRVIVEDSTVISCDTATIISEESVVGARETQRVIEGITVSTVRMMT
jgi:hypothetical protein